MHLSHGKNSLNGNSLNFGKATGIGIGMAGSIGKTIGAGGAAQGIGAGGGGGAAQGFGAGGGQGFGGAAQGIGAGGGQGIGAGTGAGAGMHGAGGAAAGGGGQAWIGNVIGVLKRNENRLMDFSMDGFFSMFKHRKAMIILCAPCAIICAFAIRNE